VSDELATVELVRRAYEQTVAAGTARIVLITEHDWGPSEPTPPRRRRMPVRFVGSVAKAIGKRMLKSMTKGMDFRRMEGEGVVDFTHRRYMVDYGHYARAYVEGQEWSGLSGIAREKLPTRPDEVPTPLWLLDLLAGVTDADDEGSDVVRGDNCRRISVRVDVSRASAATPGGVAAPARSRFEELLALPVDVWLDGSCVRRVRFAGKAAAETIELWDFGVRIKSLEWTYMPSFRSPGADRGWP
jgi:hypothetical protein